LERKGKKEKDLDLLVLFFVIVFLDFFLEDRTEFRIVFLDRLYVAF
jgi:hypothetical protein